MTPSKKNTKHKIKPKGSESIFDAIHTAYKDAFRYEQDFNLIPTGVAPLDRALNGGFRERRIHEIFGKWQTGKSVILYKWLALNQQNGGISVLFDSEGAFDPEWFGKLGGDPDSLHLFQSLTVEALFDTICSVLDHFSKDKESPHIAIGWDSLAQTATEKLKAEGLGGKRDMSMAYQIDRGSKLVLSKLRKVPATLLVLNQIREKMNAEKWDPTHTPGGNGWKHATTTRVELRFAGSEDGGSIIREANDKQGLEIGRLVRGKVVKHRQGTPRFNFHIPIYTVSGAVHPVFEDTRTEGGVDCDEALLIWYLDNPSATFGDKERYLEKAGSYIKVNEKLLGGNIKSFRKSDWLKVLNETPQLRNPDSLYDANSIPA